MPKALIALLLIGLVNGIGISLFMPLLPFIVQHYDVGDHRYGILLGIYSLGTLVAAPVFGSLSDRYGRKPLLLISQAGTILSLIVFALAFSLPEIFVGGIPIAIWVMFLSRILDGVTGGNISVANAYLADITPAHLRAQRFGLLGAMFGISFAVGPLLGGWLAQYDYSYPVRAAVIISLIALVVLSVWLDESLPEDERNIDVSIVQSLQIRRQFSWLRDRPLIRSHMWVVLFFGYAFNGMITLNALYATQVMGFGEQSLGIMYGTIGALLIVWQGYGVRVLTQRFDHRWLYTTALAGFGLVFVWMFFPLQIRSGLCIIVIITYCVSLIMALSKASTTQGLARQEQGISSGIYETIMSCDRVLAPVVMSAWRAIWGVGSYSILIVISLIALIIYLIAIPRTPRL